MTEKFIDLHVHSTFSDGTYTPGQLMETAARKSLKAIALTDHDTCDGIKEAREAAQKHQIELVPGVELSTEYKGQEIHIVGLYIDGESKNLTQAMSLFRQSRDHRNDIMVDLLQKQGFDITMEALIKDNPDAVITRANIARFLVDHGQIGSIQHVFDRYLGDDCCCYVPRKKVSSAEACRLIKEAKGIPVLAHPLLYGLKRNELYELINDLKPQGLMAMEAMYGTYDKGQEKEMLALAKEKGLLVSGGSDFHGDNKPYIHLGSGKNSLAIPYSVLEKLKNAL